MAENQQPENTTFHSLTGVLRRRWWVIFIALLVPAAALAFSLSQEKEYTSSAAVLFKDTGGPGGASVLASEQPEREAATNVELFGLGAIKERVRQRLGGRVANNVSVVQEGESNVLTLKVKSPNPDVAARTANAYALEYVRFRRQAELSDIRERERFLRSELETVPAFGPGSQRSTSIRGQLRRLKFEASSTSDAARVVSTARPAGSPSAPKPVQNTILAALVGLFLAGLVALLFERLDPRLKSPKEAEAIFDRPLLGVVHRSRALSRPVAGRVPAHDFDNFLALRAYLRFLGPNGDIRSVMVTSSASGDGKTTVAWNLACAAASSERRVLLIEADVRAPTLANALKVQPESGLSDVLAGRAQLGQITRDVAVESLQNGRQPARIVSVVFAGGGPGTTDPIAWERLGKTIEEAEQEYELIVIDTAPLISVPDAVPLISYIDGVIVIGRIGNTPRAALARLKDQLETVDASTVGVVVNSVGKDPEYGYGYGYGYQVTPAGQGD